MSETAAEHDLVGQPPPSLGAPNVGPGPDPFDFEALEEGTDAVVLLLLRDYHCTKCRSQVGRLADRYEAFRERDAEVVAVLPEPVDRMREWEATPFPLLADPETSVAEAYDQPVRFGLLGSLSDFAGRMPEAVVVDTTGAPEIAHVHRGESYGDRPTADELLELVERC